MYCKQCNELNDDDAVFCKRCGAKLIEQPTQGAQTQNHGVRLDQMDRPYDASSPKSKIITLVLCFFLGGIGIHRFYTGNNDTGGVMLFMSLSYLLALTGVDAIVFIVGLLRIVVGIWVFIDFFKILFNKFTDGNGLVVSKD